MAGLGTARSSAAASVIEGKSLKLLAFQGPGTHVAFTIQLLTEWVQQNGGKLSTITVPYSALLDKVMATIIAEDASVDAFYLDFGFVPFVQRGLTPLDPFLPEAAEARAHISPTLLELYSVNSEHYCIPHESDTPLLIYRQDLFEAPAEQAAYKQKFGTELRFPQNFDELLQVAQFFYRKKGDTLAGQPTANEFYGIALSGKPYISTSRQWEMFLHGFGGRVLNDKNRPVFNDEAGQKATAFYTDFVTKYQVAPPGTATIDAPGVDTLLNRGAAAMAPIYPSGIPYQAAPGITFGGVPWYSATAKAWGLCAHRASKNLPAVWQAIKFLNERQTQLRFGLMGAEPTRDDVLSDPQLVAKRPLLQAMIEVHRRSRPQPQIPEVAYIWNTESQPISEIIAQHTPVKQALDKTVNEITQYLKQAGYDL